MRNQTSEIQIDALQLARAVVGLSLEHRRRDNNNFLIEQPEAL